MADELPQWETSDNEGSTVSYNGTATTSNSNVPSVSGNVISQFLIIADDNNLQGSFDGGTTFHSFKKGEAFTWDLKGSETQIVLKTSSGTADWRAVLNLEAS